MSLSICSLGWFWPSRSRGTKPMTRQPVHHGDRLKMGYGWVRYAQQMGVSCIKYIFFATNMPIDTQISNQWVVLITIILFDGDKLRYRTIFWNKQFLQTQLEVTSSVTLNIFKNISCSKRMGWLWLIMSPYQVVMFVSSSWHVSCSFTCDFQLPQLAMAQSLAFGRPDLPIKSTGSMLQPEMDGIRCWLCVGCCECLWHDVFLQMFFFPTCYSASKKGRAPCCFNTCVR